MKNFLVWFCILFTVIHTAQAKPTGSTTLVISQIYGDGGTTGSTYTNDFIEIYNKGTLPVNLSNYSVQYSSGTSWTATALTPVVLQAGGYYLVKEASSGTGGMAIPYADVTGTLSMHANNGKVALVNSTSILPNGCTSPLIVDLVGYGNANCFEGTAASGGTNILSLIRNSTNTDTDNNSADFTTTLPNARSSTTFVLPIIINNFSGYKKQYENELHWQLNVLSPSVTIQLQRSTDGINFSQIYTETATRYRCTSPFIFTDHQAPNGINSYRLKINNNIYSSVISIDNKIESKLSLTINPTFITTSAQLKYRSVIPDNIQWIITDIYGKQMKKFFAPVGIGENNIPLQVDQLAAGQYQLKGYSLKGNTIAIKFIKD